MKYALFPIILALIFFSYSCKEHHTIVPVFVKVIDEQSQEPIVGAKVIFNAIEDHYSDEEGIFTTTYNLHEFLADSIVLEASKKGYHLTRFSAIIGNTQKDIFLLQMERK